MQLKHGFIKAGSAVFCFLLALLFNFSTSFGQTLNSKWDQDLSTNLQEFMSCRNTNPQGVNTCNKFIGSSVNTVYKINDFYSKELGRYMLVNEIDYYLKNSGKWTLIGHGYEQKALSEAQKYANAKRAVVAVYLNEENIGNVAIILPGELSPSGSWGFQVPNSASFFINEPEKSYIGKGLSYAFTRNLIRHVMLYVRNY